MNVRIGRSRSGALARRRPDNPLPFGVDEIHGLPDWQRIMPACGRRFLGCLAVRVHAKTHRGAHHCLAAVSSKILIYQNFLWWTHQGSNLGPAD